jgi:uncharacterized membrane protein
VTSQGYDIRKGSEQAEAWQVFKYFITDYFALQVYLTLVYSSDYRSI